MNSLKYTISTIFFIIACSSNLLYAYIDPGTGSLLLSTIVGLVMALAFSFRGFAYKLFARLSGKSFKGSNNFSGKLVFFNEGKNYWKVFKPVLDELIENEISFVYLSADQDDPGLKIESQLVEKHYLGNIKQAIIVLNNLQANVCVMTTPQLNILTLKRSKHVKHYCHILHAPADIHTYKKFAFDYFDSVLCTSSFQIENLKQLDKDRHNSKKQLFETGNTYYDLAKVNNTHGEAILLGPTWGEKSFMKKYGITLIEKILDGNYKLIYRPHPQSWVSDKELINSIQEKFGENSNFSIDKDSDNKNSMLKSKLLICDISGIIYDVAFIYNKPVIAINQDWDMGGYEASDIENEQSALELLNDVGKLININDIENINEVINEASNKTINSDIINKHLFNFQTAGKIAAQQIISIYEKTK